MAVDGTWDVTMNTPMGDRRGTLQLKTDGGGLSGAWMSTEETQAFRGTVDGDAFAGSTVVAAPMGEMELVWEGEVDGDEISGRVQFGGLGNGSFRGIRTE